MDNTFEKQASLGERLKSKREELGLSQEALAQKLYVTRQTISGWERGRSEPDLATLQKLSALYGLTVDALLNGVQVEERDHTLQGAAGACYVLGIVLTGAALLGAIWGNMGVLPLALCFGYGVVTNTIIWFAFGGAIKSGEVSMLAGFEDRAYHVPTLRRLLDAQRFWLVCSTTAACIPFVAHGFFPVPMAFSLIVWVCMAHVVSCIVGVNYCVGRYSETLYINPHSAVQSKSGWPLYFFLGSMFLTLAATAIGVDFGTVENNTSGAVLFALLMTLAFIVQLVCFILDKTHADQGAQRAQPYKLHKIARIGYGVSLILDGLLVVFCL